VVAKQGDHRRAAALHREALSLFWEPKDATGVAISLDRLARVLAEQGDVEQATRIRAAAEAIPVPDALADKRAGNERELADLRAALGDAAFSRAWAEGQAMTLEDAVTCVLGKERDLPE
jgi:hypothetical protein